MNNGVLSVDVHKYKHTDHANDSSLGEDLSTGNAPGVDEHESHENSIPRTCAASNNIFIPS
jgi:hypothetical protein